jgi:spore coat protein U-like protein
MKRSGIFLLILPFLLVPLAGTGRGADSAVLSVSATLLSKSQCKFNSSAATLDFGNLDPANPVLATATTTLPMVCHGSAPIATFQVTDDDGLFETGPNANRMRHQTNPAAYLPYQLSYSPATGSIPKNATQTLTITGQIQGSDYQSALAGTYADTVILTIQP